jgi:hypothetical protein
MSVSCMTNDFAILRPRHVIFPKLFSKGSLHVNLPSCLKHVSERGTVNWAHDGDGDGAVPGGAVKFGSRITFGCAGAGSTEISPAVWSSNLLCKVFHGVSDDERDQIKAGSASI